MYYGKKVCLRAYKEEDIKLAAKYINDEEMMKYYEDEIPFPVTLWEKEKLIKSKGGIGEYNFAIEDRETRKYIGECNIQKVNLITRTALVGIMIGDREYWGQGYGTDAMRVLLKFIFQNMNMHKVKLRVFSFNERAIKSYEKCGFKVEGILKDEIFKDGKYYDEVLMAVFEKEFNQ
ncbi:GNAT family N-acetyltransferase [Clostridium guangxiense]|uniref:GNAT family N-acetyltransferase n=2 Tax=Clostridium TaxID=1485 RepID=UPI001E3ECF4C|nr:GNAT family N-acetyltransferase [Clostridium guangxiense]